MISLSEPGGTAVMASKRSAAPPDLQFQRTALRRGSGPEYSAMKGLFCVGQALFPCGGYGELGKRMNAQSTEGS
jgi:hypothetical protein